MKGLHISLISGIVALSIAANLVQTNVGIALGGGVFDLLILLTVILLFEALYRRIFKC